MSPQHWAHEYYKHTGKSEKEITTRHNIKLSWNNENNNKTVDLDENGDVGNIYTTQGYDIIRQIYSNNSTFKDNEQDIDMNRQWTYWKTNKYMPLTKQINSQGNVLKIDEMEEIPHYVSITNKSESKTKIGDQLNRYQRKYMNWHVKMGHVSK